VNYFQVLFHHEVIPNSDIITDADTLELLSHLKTIIL